VLLVPAYAVVVAAPSGPDQGCPSPRQITDALMARIPAVVVPTYEASSPGVLRLSVSGGAGAVPLRIELTDPGGEARLYRNLTLAERGRGSECTALAETVALIVDRFLHDLGYEAPPSPPPALKSPDENLARGPPAAAPKVGNRYDLLAGGSWRGDSSIGEDDFEMALGLGLERGLGARRLAVSLSTGLSLVNSGTLRDGTSARFRRVPLRLGLFLPLSVGPGWLEPGLRLVVDWLMTSEHDQRHTHASPGGEAVLGYRIPLVRRLFARLSASVGVSRPYAFTTMQDGAGAPRDVFSQPLVYAKSGLELGFSFQ
jgi:hypothetical protein